jgi:selT/selW/selH-like putative selenoprotein
MFGDERIEPELEKGGGGVFDVTVDGRPIYSKHTEGRFPQYQEIPTAITMAGLAE